MPPKTTSLEACRTIGIDIGKNTFHLIGLDKIGAIVLRQKLSRNQVDIRLANMPRCLSKIIRSRQPWSSVNGEPSGASCD